MTYQTWTFAGVDMYASYLPWFAHIRATGIAGAFAAPFGSYAPPYLYMLALATPLVPTLMSFSAVKLVSYAGHLLLAMSAARLLRVVGHARPWSAAAIVALAPSLFINPAILIQCDAWWAAPLVMALAAAIERRHGWMFLWCGLAVGFKLQAAFAGPLFLAIALAHRVPLRWWLVAPGAFLTTLLPAWMAGWPIYDLLTIYWRQVEFTDQLSLAAPNVWTLVQELPLALPQAVGSLGSVAAVLASVVYVAVFSRRLRHADPVAVLDAACLAALMVPGLLPRMHERYFFLADVLTLTWAMVRPRQWRVAALVQFGSFAAIWSYLTGATGLAAPAAAAMMIASWMVLRPYLFDPRPDRQMHRGTASVVTV